MPSSAIRLCARGACKCNLKIGDVLSLPSVGGVTAVGGQSRGTARPWRCSLSASLLEGTKVTMERKIEERRGGGGEAKKVATTIDAFFMGKDANDG
ncbi:hypothetical protein niasHT_013192 [Heterodera trifolii]|uniref:Uncharacterized protein n=1 Tax=Heterodera trifolii TaxID=157864 RepID=A0ABD2KU24_9BILA